MESRDIPAGGGSYSPHVVDPGLLDAAGTERLLLIRANLTARDGSQSVDLDRLDRLGQALDEGSIDLPTLLKQYFAATDSGRWPIVVVRATSTDRLSILERELMAAGLIIDANLEAAYKRVSVLPVRIPPETSAIEALATLPGVGRIERSWLKGAPPEFSAPSRTMVVHPDNLLSRELLPSELLSKRDPLRIALIDSGLDATHAALKTRLQDQRSMRRGVSAIGDQVGRGTAAAGIIARLCTAATFLAAKVMDRKRGANLDNLVRSTGWLLRHRPDIVVCNVLLPLPADGRSILSGALKSLRDAGALVIVPCLDDTGEIAAPGNTSGILTVAPTIASSATGASMRAPGHQILAPKGIQADDDLFPDLDYPGWTVFSGPSAAAAVVTGVAGLLVRVARLHRHTPTPDELQDILLSSADDGVLNANNAVRAYRERLTAVRHVSVPGRPDPPRFPSAGKTGPVAFQEAPTAIGAVMPTGAEIAARAAELLELQEGDSATTMPLTQDARRALTQLADMHNQGTATEPFDVATIKGELPAELHELLASDAPDDELEWWPESIGPDSN